MSATLVIGNKNYSSWSLRAWLAAKHLKLEFREVCVPLYREDSRKRLLQYSAAAKVPVYIDDDGSTVWDSLAICEWLAEQYPQLWPSDSRARAAARSVSAEMHAGFSALRNELPMNCRATGRKVMISEQTRSDIGRIGDSWTWCRTEFGNGGPWLFGSFSIADAMYAPVASRLETYGVELDIIPERYKQTVLSYPLMQQWYREAAEEPDVIASSEVGRG